ncbi:hypothetical protein DPMN_185524 [Dreissena polymorpha]|uniref:Uncharacterized protein n=1 Tax=Dreissena polymorpha TaxID=45954 RepID=A0A9D4I7D6_DREPO|nr:hypothetical protein DPMN_185524 [Dreissena polymorpha]
MVRGGSDFVGPRWGDFSGFSEPSVPSSAYTPSVSAAEARKLEEEIDVGPLFISPPADPRTEAGLMARNVVNAPRKRAIP